MKKIQLLITLFAISFFACDQSSTTENIAVKEANASSTQNKLPAKKEACEFFSLNEIGKIFDWNPTIINQELMMKLEKYNKTVCRHFTPDGEKFTIRVNWKSEKAQENQVLKNQFSNYLSKGENNLTYKKSNTSIGSESLFGHGSDRDHKTIYILRTRFQNEVEIIIEGAFDKNSPSDFENKFKEILKKMI